MKLVRQERVRFTSSRIPSPEIVPQPLHCDGCRRTVQPVVIDSFWEGHDLKRYSIFDDLHEVIEEICARRLHTVFEFAYPCICDLKPPYSHWILAVAKKECAGWDVEPPPLQPLPGGSGEAMIDDGRSLPGPRPCTSCGRVVPAQIVERWTARGPREAIWGPGEHYPNDETYKIPLKMLIFRHACVCEARPPYSAFQRVFLKKSPGWDDVSV